jgi:hypothetical protein
MSDSAAAGAAAGAAPPAQAQPDVFRRLWNASFTSVRVRSQRTACTALQASATSVGRL